MIGSKDSKENLFVVEIDVTPSTNFTGDDMFFTRHKTDGDRKTTLMFYRLKHDSKEPILGTGEEIVNYVAIKSKLTQDRKIQEEKTLNNKVNENLRQKFLDLFSAGFETIKEELHPVLLLSPLESNLSEEYVAKNFQFLTDIDPTVVFDFDSCIKEIGMFHFVENEQEQCLKVLTTDSLTNQAKNT